jgi:glycosyltransferase involved in cell wall biosynthesis
MTMPEDARPASRKIVLISERFGHSGGGEAIKGQHYADFLLQQGHDVVVVTHERSVRSLGAHFPAERLRLVPDTALQRFLWRVAPLRGVLSPYFHWQVRSMLMAEAIRDGAAPLLHYISPVSPVALRFPPRGSDVVMGPMTGNIYYPPAFRSRMSGKDRLREALHGLSQRLLRRLAPEKTCVGVLLVSGYERTRASLRLAGAEEGQMLDVVDAGVKDSILARPRLHHAGVNRVFVCSGRMVDHKGTDLAIKALTRTDPRIRLDIFGDGETRPGCEALVARLGLGERVSFKGWMASHDALLDAFAGYRGYVFPSLAEANGIVMQEAMAIGLPVIALRWGGPAMLADETAALYVDPRSEPEVIADLARAMDRLASDGAFADGMAARARAIAERNFTWAAVARTWQRSYQKFGHGDTAFRLREY